MQLEASTRTTINFNARARAHRRQRKSSYFTNLSQLGGPYYRAIFYTTDAFVAKFLLSQSVLILLRCLRKPFTFQYFLYWLFFQCDSKIMFVFKI